MCFALHSDEALLQKDSSMHTKRCDRNTISMCPTQPEKYSAIPHFCSAILPARRVATADHTSIIASRRSELWGGFAYIAHDMVPRGSRYSLHDRFKNILRLIVQEFVKSNELLSLDLPILPPVQHLCPCHMRLPILA